MCTIAKVSIFLLDEPFHGYYLHCRSPHQVHPISHFRPYMSLPSPTPPLLASLTLLRVIQFADGSMPELVEMLHKEEAGLTVDRSLDGITPCSPIMRHYIMSVYMYVYVC